MNHVTLIGRLTRDPEIRYTQNNMPVARYSLAIDRPRSQNSQQQADFINCICFDKRAEFAQNYLHRGQKIAVEGRLQSGSYQRQDGTKAYTLDVVVNAHEFCESRQDSQQDGNGYQGNNYQANNAAQPYATQNQPQQGYIGDGFMAIPQGVDDEGLSWN